MGGDDRRAARRTRSTGTATTGRPTRTSPAAHPNARFTDAGRPVPVDRAPSGRTPPACRSTPSCSAAAARRVVPLVTEAFDWEHGVFLGATMAVRDDRRGRGRRSASCASTRWRCCRSAATTWPTTSRTGSRSGQPRTPDEAAADLPRQLVPQGRGRQVPLARLRREQPRARVGLPPLRRRGRDRRDADRPACPAEGELNTEGARHLGRARCASCSPSTPDASRRSCRRSRSTSTQFGDELPARSRAQLEALEAAPGLGRVALERRPGSPSGIGVFSAVARRDEHVAQLALGADGSPSRSIASSRRASRSLPRRSDRDDERRTRRRSAAARGSARWPRRRPCRRPSVDHRLVAAEPRARARSSPRSK